MSVIMSHCLSFVSRRQFVPVITNCVSTGHNTRSVYHIFNKNRSRLRYKSNSTFIHSFTMEPAPICPVVLNGHGSKEIENKTKDFITQCDKIKINYERAVNELHCLMSNAETIAKASKLRAERQRTVIPNMNRFLRRSGLSERDIDDLSIIHVSGTKGKGSTCAFLERILHSKGYKTGLFSSPHLVEVRERFRINGRPISRDLFVGQFWKVYSKLRETQTDERDMPAYFAFNVILGFHVFMAAAVDVIIMEVGIGGEYDSTNFIRHPAVCGVTSLGMDHVSLLGNTLEEIAWNKAGIFKPGRPAMTVLQSPSCLEVILNRAKERKSPLHIVPELSHDLLAEKRCHLGIDSHRQVVNASLAVHLARAWEKSKHTETLPCNVEDVSATEDIATLLVTDLTDSEIKGLSSCVWPGRAQTIKRSGITYYLDGAHTKESMEVCCEWFRHKSKEEEKSIRGKTVKTLLFNVTGDRNIHAIMNTLKKFCTFDAAAFSTNVLSTVASYNVADQVVKVPLQSDMVRKAELNRLLWEKIVVNDCDDNINNNCVGLENGDYKKPSISVAESSSPACKGQINGLAECAPSPKKARCVSDRTGSNALHLSTEPATSNPSVNTLPNPPNKSLEDTCVNDVSENGHLHRTEGVSGKPLKTLSHSFPCVLQALAWASQNRDPSVKVIDPDASPTAIPAYLRDADHIQVLITGSLHLVGAALVVLDPHMND